MKQIQLTPEVVLARYEQKPSENVAMAGYATVGMAPNRSDGVQWWWG